MYFSGASDISDTEVWSIRQYVHLSHSCNLLNKTRWYLARTPMCLHTAYRACYA